MLELLQTTYEAAAERGGWDRGDLEANYPAPGKRIDPDRALAFPSHHPRDPGAGGA